MYVLTCSMKFEVSHGISHLALGTFLWSTSHNQVRLFLSWEGKSPVTPWSSLNLPMIFNGTGQGEMSNYWWILSSAVALKFSFLCLFCSYNTLLCVILLFSSFLRLYCISDSLSRFQSMLSKFTLHTNVELVYEEHSVDVNWAHNECRISVWGGTKYIFHSA